MRWIPCSERLPEDDTLMLVNYIDSRPEAMDIWIGWHEMENVWYINGEAHSKEYGNEVIAWMPLPEPYKGNGMDDLISRQAIMKEFADFVRKSNNSDFAQTPTWNDAVSLVGSMPSELRLSEEDLQEIQDRFGDFVRFVVEDMITGEEKRWNNER